MVVIILSAEESDQCSEGVEGKMQFLLPDPGGRREALFPAGPKLPESLDLFSIIYCFWSILFLIL